MVSVVVETTIPVASVVVNLVDSDKKIAVLEAVTPVVALEVETPADSEAVTPVVALVVETPAVVAVVTMAMACS